MRLQHGHEMTTDLLARPHLRRRVIRQSPHATRQSARRIEVRITPAGSHVGARLVGLKEWQ